MLRNFSLTSVCLSKQKKILLSPFRFILDILSEQRGGWSFEQGLKMLRVSVLRRSVMKGMFRRSVGRKWDSWHLLLENPAVMLIVRATKLLLNYELNAIEKSFEEKTISVSGTSWDSSRKWTYTDRNSCVVPNHWLEAPYLWCWH